MIAPADIEKMAARWKRATWALKIEDKKYGNKLAQMLEIDGYYREVLKRFDDPRDAAIFIIPIGMLKELKKDSVQKEKVLCMNYRLGFFLVFPSHRTEVKIAFRQSTVRKKYY